MATRKSRLNTDSPTPSTGESVPTTPTTPATRNTRSIRNKQQKSDEPPIVIKTEKTDEDEEAVKDTEDEMGASTSENADAKEIDAKKETIVKEKETVSASTRKRRIAAVKEEPFEKPNPNDTATVSPATTDDGKISPAKAKRQRRSAIEILMGSKANTPKIVGKRRNSTGKIEKPARKLSSRIKKLKQMRKVTLKRTLLKKPDKVSTAVNKPVKQLIEKLDSKQTKKGGTKVDKNADSASDSELIKITRRRSDSVSKCSDMTDTSSFQETKDSEELPAAHSSDISDAKIEIKQEIVDKDDSGSSTSKAESDLLSMTRSTTGLNDSGIGGENENSSQVTEQVSGSKRPRRRLRRTPLASALPQKVMNTRSRSDTPSKLENIVKTSTETDDTTIEETEAKPKEIKKDNIESQLHIETVAGDATPEVDPSTDKEQINIAVESFSTATEKAKSLSPILVSEGVSEISVKQFYGRADFLENNLGIEKDPKLGEIVQVQEKIKNENDDDDDNVDGGDKQTKDIEEVGSIAIEAIDVVAPSKSDPVLETNEITTENVSNNMEKDDIDGKDDGAKCDEVKTNEDCFVKPEQLVRKTSTSILSENLLVFNGEIEVRPKEKKNVVKKIENEMDDVVLYKITTNGISVNPETLEKVLESQKLKEKEEQPKIVPKEEDPDVEIIECTTIATSNGNHGEKLNIESNKDNTSNQTDYQNTTAKEDAEIRSVDQSIETKVDTAAVTVAVAVAESRIKIENTESIAEEKPEQNVDLPVQAKATTATSNENNSIDAESNDTKENIDGITPQIEPAKITITSGSKDSRSSSIDDESPEDKMQKESHLKTLGLLTHQAAVEATIEKQKQREKFKASVASSSHGGKGKKNPEYTGTLKTVIKLHRGNNNDKKKSTNLPLKMTLHKGRAKNGGSDKGDSNSAANSEEDTYYTIQQQDMDAMDPSEVEAAYKEHEKLLVIPEKASSFRYHPEKICEDQCFYCGGKFGLFDTPCHIAQIKSAERQKKILEYEEKLTVDSCLCDACFRHVDRRANCSYKKRLSVPATMSEIDVSGNDIDDKTLKSNASTNETAVFQINKELSWCQVQLCKEQAPYSVRRKWVIKARKSICKQIQFNFDNVNSMTFIPICDKHYDDSISHLMECALCNRRLKRNHCYFISQDPSKTESMLTSEGIPVVIRAASVVCKLCRYYVHVLQKPQEAKKTDFAKDYRKRLLEFHKAELIEDDSESDNIDRSRKDSNDYPEPVAKRARVPKRGRKSTPDELSSATNSDDGHSKPSKPNAVEVDNSMDTSSALQDSTLNATLANTSSSSTSTTSGNRTERNRQKNKQSSQQQLFAEQQRVEQRVLQEQLKLKHQELLQQQQKIQEELRQQQLRASNEDISNLRTNPNISMRELFPGEEEMGLNVNIPFAAGSWRTPEGWTKVTSTVQYDEPTRRLWEELQKPYGNQSSFLRHLLLLEKYFRNGDLLLTPGANMNAVTYAESVQHRLQAYDNILPRPVSLAQITPSIVQSSTAVMDLSQSGKTAIVANNAVTVSKAIVPKANTTKPAANDASNSLLKSNAPSNQRTRSYTVTTEPINPEKTSAVANKTDLTKLNNLNTNSSSNSSIVSNSNTPKNKTSIGLPPELICINTSTPNDKQQQQQQQLAQPSYQLQMQLTLQQQIQQQHQNSLLLTQQHKLQQQMLQNITPPQPIVPPLPQVTTPKKQPHTQTTATNLGNSTSINPPPVNQNNACNNKANVIRLPDTLTEAERLESKHWKPTLVPVTSDKNSNNNEWYQTADGRRLQYWVQVQSGGKPYMISIHDYNRMCILRRERFLRDQEQMLKNKNAQQTVPPSAQNAPAPVAAPPLSIVSQASKPTSTITSGLLAAATTAAPNNVGVNSFVNMQDAEKLSKSHTNLLNSNTSHSLNLVKKVQIPNKILEQNSLIPITTKTGEMTSDSLLKARKNQSSLLKTNAMPNQAKSIAPQHLVPSNASVTATVVAPNTAKLPLSLASALSQSNVVSITSTPSISAILAMNSGSPASTPPPIQLIPQPLTITSVSSLPLAASNQANVSALEALFKTTNQVTTTPTTMWQWAESLNKSNSGNVIGITPIDNSATSILSKIPKSLTVIPQQKRLSKGNDDAM